MEVNITLEKACYFPGEVLKCLIKVRRTWTDGSTAVKASSGGAADASGTLELLFECAGSERVDPSWVGRLYHPEVTAQKDNKRMVRSIFSTGQVPLLEGAMNHSLSNSREFVVRCRLPTKLPPSYRGNAVRFLYTVAVHGRLLPAGGAPAAPAAKKQQQPQGAPAAATCQAHTSFVVWPQPDRSSGSSSLERRASMPMATTPLAATAAAAAGSGALAAAAPGAGGSAAAAAGGGGAAAAGAAGAAAGGGAGAPVVSSLPEGLQEVEQIDYKLGMTALKLRWEEVLLNADGTRTLVTHEPTAPLYPAGSTAGQLLQAAQMCALDALQLEEGRGQQRSAAAAAGPGGEDADGEGGGSSSWLRQLTPAQRASMSVRTFNLRAGEYPLLRLVLQPPTDGLLQPGGTFGLLLDFRAAHGAAAAAAAAGIGGGGGSLQPVCLQVVALLEAEELVLPPYAPARASQGITAMRKLYAEQQEVTAHLLTSHFTFSIPLTAPPSFKTPMVCHKWVLRFELTLGKPKPKRPGELLTEQLLWSLPLVVYPPLPQAQAGM